MAARTQVNHRHPPLPSSFQPFASTGGKNWDKMSHMENVVLCPVCGHPNPSEAHRCARCRARLAGGEVVSKERGEELARERRRARRRRRLIRWGLVALVLLGLGGWPGYKNFGPGRFLSSPESDISAVPAPGDWPMYQRDPAHSAFAPNEGAPKGKLKWRFVTDAPILSSPAVVGGRVYLTTGDRRIVALGRRVGRPW